MGAPKPAGTAAEPPDTKPRMRLAPPSIPTCRTLPPLPSPDLNPRSPPTHAARRGALPLLPHPLCLLHRAHRLLPGHHLGGPRPPHVHDLGHTGEPSSPCTAHAVAVLFNFCSCRGPGPAGDPCGPGCALGVALPGVPPRRACLMECQAAPRVQTMAALGLCLAGSFADWPHMLVVQPTIPTSTLA